MLRWRFIVYLILQISACQVYNSHKNYIIGIDFRDACQQGNMVEANLFLQHGIENIPLQYFYSAIVMTQNEEILQKLQTYTQYQEVLDTYGTLDERLVAIENQRKQRINNLRNQATSNATSNSIQNPLEKPSTDSQDERLVAREKQQKQPIDTLCGQSTSRVTSNNMQHSSEKRSSENNKIEKNIADQIRCCCKAIFEC